RPVVEMLELSGLLDRRLGVLSGGELRRVLLAQALLPDPELLLLDEPAAGIDWMARQTLEAAFLRLREAGKTILLVTHDLEEVRRITDRVTCLFQRVRFDGPPARVLTPEAALSAFRPEEPDG
ncbi:MAG: ATP-binding cassette domain-containing protein, partial [Deltaproteobacteria bacterium]